MIVLTLVLFAVFIMMYGLTDIIIGLSGQTEVVFDSMQSLLWFISYSFIAAIVIVLFKKR